MSWSGPAAAEIPLGGLASRDRSLLASECSTADHRRVGVGRERSIDVHNHLLARASRTAQQLRGGTLEEPASPKLDEHTVSCGHLLHVSSEQV